MKNRAGFILIPLGFLLITAMVLSLKWRMVHDSPIMLYIAFLMERFDYVPYRDFFDMNMPGTYLINLLVGRVFGYNDTGFRIADLFYLIMILAATRQMMKPLGRQVAFGSAVLFGLVYLGLGPEMSMQREFLLLLPIGAAVYLSTSLPGLHPGVKAGITGLFFGLAAIIKPHAVVSWPLLMIFQVRATGQRECCRKTVFGAAALGFAIPVLAGLVYLWQAGALPYYLDIAVNYWPLYGRLNGEHWAISGLDRVKYLIKGLLTFGYHFLWLLTALLGIYIAFYRSGFSEKQKQHVLLLMGMAALYGVYPAFSGQFWVYHWLPFLYFTVMLSSLCFTDQLWGAARIEKVLPAALVVVVLLFYAYPPKMVSYAKEAPKDGRVDKIAAYIGPRLKPGDLVQPLDWTGGAVHGMLIARARLATPFIYDFHFYHHVSDNYIQKLRRQFISGFKTSKPRFVIEITAEDKPWVSGPDTTREFPELKRVIEEQYKPVDKGDGFVIYERN